MRLAVLAAVFLIAVPASVYGQAPGSIDDDQVPISFTLNKNPHTLHTKFAADGGGVLGNRSNGSLLGIDSLSNWSSYFYYPGVDGNGFPQFTWQYTMVGHSPFATGNDDENGGTTSIGAPVVPVNLDLRNFDGSPRFVGGKRLFSDATQYLKPVLKSPVFSNTFYSSSVVPTQFTDAVQRAEFINKAGDNWHTLLHARTAMARTLVLVRGTYRFALNSDGSCCAFVLIDFGTFINGLFPATATDTTTPIGAAENAGDIRTRDLSTFLLPNAFLYFHLDPTQCCVIGFHSYDLEPGGADNSFRERRYVMNYSAWISPGIFSDPTFGDISALSHEMAETFNDPGAPPVVRGRDALFSHQRLLQLSRHQRAGQSEPFAELRLHASAPLAVSRSARVGTIPPATRTASLLTLDHRCRGELPLAPVSFAATRSRRSL